MKTGMSCSRPRALPRPCGGWAATRKRGLLMRPASPGGEMLWAVTTLRLLSPPMTWLSISGS